MDSLQEKVNVKVIGILGSCKGAGVTTLSIAMANYLAEIMYAKTAILECDGSNDFEFMVNLKCVEYEGNSFSIGKVDYYYRMDMSLFFATYANEYEYIIIDFGSDFNNFKANISNIRHKILLGSALPFKCQYHDRLINNLEGVGLKDDFLHLLAGDEKSIKEYSEKHRINALSSPVMINPYIIDCELASFFQLLF